MAAGRLTLRPSGEPGTGACEETKCQAIVLAPDVVSYYSTVVNGYPRWYTVPLSRVVRISWDDDPFSPPKPERCSSSGTNPKRSEYWDCDHPSRYADAGAFYWCQCGAILEWIGTPGEPGASLPEHDEGRPGATTPAGDEIDYLRQFIANLSPDELEAAVESLIGVGGQDKLGEWIKTALMQMVEAP